MLVKILLSCLLRYKLSLTMTLISGLPRWAVILGCLLWALYLIVLQLMCRLLQVLLMCRLLLLLLLLLEVMVMSRNANGRFSEVPTASISRSKFDRSCSIKTTFNAGELIPFFVDEVLPGDTFSVDTAKVVRLQTPLTPFMDNIFLDTYYFFVPARLCWEHWRNLMGENTESAWISESVYTVPQVTAPAGGWSAGTIADYMGIPTSVAGLSVNAMPFRAYSLIVNDWFRDENLQDPLNIPLGDATQAGSNGNNYITDCALGGKPFVAGKLHDYFTSALPAPQK